jgi:seryl-tRNA synthetase
MLLRRGEEFVPLIDELLAIDMERRVLISEVEKLKAERNRTSKAIGELFKKGRRKRL